MNTRFLKQMLTVFALMVGALTVLSVLPGIVHASDLIDPSRDNPQAIANRTQGEGNIRQLVLTMVNYFLGFLGIIAVIMVIYGGVTYVTAAGRDEAIGNAKKIILYAVVGLIIILISFALINTILGAGLGSAPA